jgi:outer membrane protein TolC
VSHRIALVSCLAALAACRTAKVGPDDAPDPAPLLGPASGVEAEVAFQTDGEPDEACVESAELSLADAVREALVHDPRVQQALARWRRAKVGADAARRLPNPLLSVAFMLGRTLSDAKVSVGISEEIAAYLQRPHKAGAADARLRGSAEEALAVALDVVAEARAAYLAAQDADARRPSAERRLEILGRLRDAHRESLREREGLPGDLTALEAEIASIDLELAELDADRIRARIELARVIGRPSDAGAWTLAAWPALPDAAGAARPWIDGALARRPEIRAIGWELAALGEERALVETWPWEGGSFGVAAEYDDGLVGGPAVEVPLRLFDSSAPRTAAIEAAESELRHRAVEARRAVIRDVRVALADEAAARRALELLDRGLLPLLEKRRGQIDEAKRAGEVEIAILVLADRELHDARARRVELERRVLEARIRLERAAGGPGAAPFPPPGPREPEQGGTER